MKLIYLLKKELNSFKILFLKINRGYMVNLIIIIYLCIYKSMKYVFFLSIKL